MSIAYLDQKEQNVARLNPFGPVLPGSERLTLLFRVPTVKERPEITGAWR